MQGHQNTQVKKMAYRSTHDAINSEHNPAKTVNNLAHLTLRPDDINTVVKIILHTTQSMRTQPSQNSQ